MGGVGVGRGVKAQPHAMQVAARTPSGATDDASGAPHRRRPGPRQIGHRTRAPRRQALSLPEDERRDLVAKLAASLPEEDDGIELDPADVAEAVRELEAHRADPSAALSADEARAWLAARRTAG